MVSAREPLFAKEKNPEKQRERKMERPKPAQIVLGNAYTTLPDIKGIYEESVEKSESESMNTFEIPRRRTLSDEMPPGLPRSETLEGAL